MVRAGMCVAAGVFAVVAAWVGFSFTPTRADAAPPPDAPPTVPVRADAKVVDLTALRDAVDTAAAKGENVDEIRKALDAFEKTAPKPAAGRVSSELQALRDAVDSAAKKGENVEAITKELVAVETAVAGRALTKPKPEPRPNPAPDIGPGGIVRPLPPNLPFPILPNPGIGGAGVGGGVDVETFNKAMELRRKAIELMLKNPDDPEVRKEAQKLQQEAAELMLKAARGLGGAGGVGGIAMPLPFPEVGRVPDRARLGIRLERVPAVAGEQLGLDPNTGIVVTLVVAGSPAEKAGLKVHDIILEFGGKAVTDNTDEFINRVNAVKAGEKVDIVLLRKGKKVDVKGVELPEAKGFRLPPQPAPGLRRPDVANPFGKAADALDPAKLPIPPLPVLPPPLGPRLPIQP